MYDILLLTRWRHYSSVSRHGNLYDMITQYRATVQRPWRSLSSLGALIITYYITILTTGVAVQYRPGL